MMLHTPPATLDMQQVLDDIEIAIVCGSGGVGKTSVAAAMAVSEAMRGRKVCVLTIDPAKRLAEAMGLRELDDRERKVKLPGKAAPGGELWALMLDPKSAFDRLVEETAPDAAARDRILGNRIYQQISAQAAGVQEYMAIERLYELDRVGKYDLLVVDTPPAAHARDLLDGPQRLLRFFEGRSLRWFLRPSMKMGRFGLKAIGGPGGLAISAVQKVTGGEMLRDATEFFTAFEGMYDTFAERIQIVERLLDDDRTAFFVVTSPERESIDEAVEFFDVLCDRGFSFAGSIVNRIEPLTAGSDIRQRTLTEIDGISDSLARTVVRIQNDHARLAERDHRRVDELRSGTGDSPVVCVPRLPRLVNDLDGLAELTPYLYAGDGEAGESQT